MNRRREHAGTTHSKRRAHLRLVTVLLGLSNAAVLIRCGLPRFLGLMRTIDLAQQREIMLRIGVIGISCQDRVEIRDGVVESFQAGERHAEVVLRFNGVLPRKCASGAFVAPGPVERDSLGHGLIEQLRRIERSAFVQQRSGNAVAIERAIG